MLPRLDIPEGPVPPGGHPLVVALHGHGENGTRFARLLGLEASGPFATLYPTAPHTITAQGRDGPRDGSSWYTYIGDAAALLAELARAENHLLETLRAATQGQPVNLQRSVLLGHSQGGYLASFTALRNRNFFRGLVAISCRVKTEVLTEEIAAAPGYPILCIHGKRDRSVLPEPQIEEVERLKEAGLDVRLHLHDRGHGVRPETGSIVREFAAEVLAR